MVWDTHNPMDGFGQVVGLARQRPILIQSTDSDLLEKLQVRELFGGMTCLGYLGDYLEDHPMTCKWLITMVIVSPLNGFRVVFVWRNALFSFFWGGNFNYYTVIYIYIWGLQ